MYARVCMIWGMLERKRRLGMYECVSRSISPTTYIQLVETSTRHPQPIPPQPPFSPSDAARADRCARGIGAPDGLCLVPHRQSATGIW